MASECGSGPLVVTGMKTNTTPKTSMDRIEKLGNLSWLLQLLSSIYLAVLVVTGHESATASWSLRLRMFYASHFGAGARIMTDEGYQLYEITFFLCWGLTAVVFLFVRGLERFPAGGGPAAKRLANLSVGVLAVAGYPIASLYAGNARVPFMQVELAIAVLCVFLSSHRKWPISPTLSLFLLASHFLVWTWFSSFPYLCCLYIWPGWIWNWPTETGPVMRLAFPVYGFCLSVFWARCLNQVAPNPAHSTNTQWLG
jgi:hypothetical protein